MCGSWEHQRGGHLLQTSTKTPKQWLLTTVFCCVLGESGGWVPGEVNKTHI